MTRNKRRNILRIKRKADREKYCKWFLENVKREAFSREMISYAVDNRLISKSIGIDSNVLSAVMRKSPCFKNRKELTTNKKGVKSAELCVWSLMGEDDDVYSGN